MQDIFLNLLLFLINAFAIIASLIIMRISYIRGNKSLFIAMALIAFGMLIIVSEADSYTSSLISSLLFMAGSIILLLRYTKHIHKEMIQNKLESMRRSHEKFAVKSKRKKTK